MALSALVERQEGLETDHVDVGGLGRRWSLRLRLALSRAGFAGCSNVQRRNLYAALVYAYSGSLAVELNGASSLSLARPGRENMSPRRRAWSWQLTTLGEWEMAQMKHIPSR